MLRIPTDNCEGWRGLRSDGVGLRMTETEKYKLGLSPERSDRGLIPSQSFAGCLSHYHKALEIRKL